MAWFSESDSSDVEDTEAENIIELNVVIIGESGAGKSAVINQIYDTPVVRSSNQATGCTIESAKVSGVIPDYPNLRLNLYDTAGLSESDEGSMPTAKAFVQLIKLCYAIPNGINLLIFCHPKGRLSTDQFKKNYRVFKEDLCENKIPSLLVITHCDDDSPLNTWWVENQHMIRDRLKFDFVDGICVSTLKKKRSDPDNVLEAYKLSRSTLIEAVEEYATSEPVEVDSWKRKIMVYIRTWYNSLATWLSWLGLQRHSLRPELEQMFIDLKYTPDEARREAELLLEELKNPDLVGPYVCVNANLA